MASELAKTVRLDLNGKGIRCDASLSQLSMMEGRHLFELRFFLRVIVAAVLVAIAMGSPLRDAHACACCANPGERYDRSEVIDDYSRGVMTGLRFSPVAGLYRTAADWSDQIKGIDNASEADSYKLRVGRTSHALTFEMSDGQGHKGHLKFMVPLHVRKFHVHTKPELPKGDGYVPTVLYKEWRLAGVITGDGMFAFQDAAKARLIFHGQGNACTSEDQFTHWTLEAEEEGVRFRFFGRLIVTP